MTTEVKKKKAKSSIQEAMDVMEKVAQEAVAKKPKKKLAVETDTKLEKIKAELKKFKVDLEIGETEDDVPYMIKSSHHALNRIMGGGLVGATACEISGGSQTAKSFLLYDFMKSTIEMGGYCYLNDNESAWQPSYGQKIGLHVGPNFALSDEKDEIQVFKEMRVWIKAIRAVDKKSPILCGIDSFAGLETAAAIENAEAGKEGPGYDDMKKNANFSKLMKNFLPFMKEHAVTLILVNQVRIDHKITYGDNRYSLGENVISYWCTQRIRGKAIEKIKKEVYSLDNSDNVKKVSIGFNVEWEAIKARNVDPFKKIAIKTIFKTGVQPYSGLAELLANEGFLRKGTKAKLNTDGSKSKKPIKGFKLLETNEFFETIQEVIEAHPDYLDPMRESTYMPEDDEDEDEDEE